MAPNIKIDQSTVSFSKVQKVDFKSTGSSTEGVSREKLMEMIYALMLLVGQNMSLIQDSYAKGQLDQALIAQNQASATSIQTQQYLDKLSEATQAKQNNEGLATFTKVVGVVVGILAAALLCETGIGFLILAAVVVCTATPAFDSAVSSLGTFIGNELDKIAPGNSAANQIWGKIIAQVLVIVVLTVVTCGAEGVEIGLSKAATTGVEEVAELGAEEASSSVFHLGFSGASVATQTILSTNLVGEILEQINEAFPGDKNNFWRELTVAALTVIIDLVIMIASFKFASAVGEGTTFFSKLGNALGISKLGNALGSVLKTKVAFSSIMGVAGAVEAAGEGSQGYYHIKQSEFQKEMAPLQSEIVFGEGMFQTLTQLTNVAQKLYKSIMESNRTIFSTDFSSDWRSCVEAQYQG